MSRVLQAMTKNERTWNGAISYSTTGVGKYSYLMDYFAKCGTYSKRDQSAVDSDMAGIFNDDELAALRMLFGLRLVTRKPDVDGIDETQSGFGRRDEFYKGIVWLHNNRPSLLYRNLHLVPVFGSWKDFLNEPLIDTLDRNKVFDLFSENLENQLLLKYLPQIRSSKNIRSERDRKRVQWAREFAKHLKISEKDYRKLKSKGAAHVFQKQMSAGEWSKINFNGIPGKAMTGFTSRTGKDGKNVFERHGLVKQLTDWVLKQPTIKFTGYPHNLMQAAQISGRSMIKRLILDKQAEKMLEPMKNHSLGNVLACLDTSASMTWFNIDGVQPYHICLSMGIVFSMLNVGYFKDHVVSFSSQSSLVKINGGFCDRLDQITQKCHGGGSTNFQSVIDLLVKTRRKHPEIPLNEYPETLLIVSDMQFNPSNWSYTQVNEATNYEAAKRKLQSVGLGEVRIIWWHVNGQPTKDFPSQMNDKGCYMISGFDPINIKALMGLDSKNQNFNAKVKVEQTPLDGMLNFLSQPIFNLITD
jgi:hypothetical protein